MTNNAGEEQIHGFFISLVRLGHILRAYYLPFLAHNSSSYEDGCSIGIVEDCFFCACAAIYFFFELSARRLILGMAELFL